MSVPKLKFLPRGWEWHRHLLTVAIFVGVSWGSTCAASAQFRPDRPNFFRQGQEQLQQDIERLEQQRPNSIPILNIQTDSPQWSAIVLRKGGCVAWMPQGIFSSDRHTVKSADGAVVFEITAMTSRLGRFVVAFSKKTKTFAQADHRALLDRVRTRIVEDQTGFGVTNDRILTVKGHPGREFTLHNPQETIIYRVLLVQDRLYILAVSQPRQATQAAKDAIAPFFNSFQLLEKVISGNDQGKVNETL